ncbi:hypothetical protein DDZ13_05520 [Coraliomargarita sinensis]|uniref:Uncharacterized protein n=1 Tax=Coraliomargarita sinensis TaxID=2174842 RepID=A0A317ZI26_9BACT|nr:hypothetical protein [Coraliomargarita sinensis]PXA04632.1 hypothetical protein DDZ13_05520 [Coraliomargarita sinensis]
MYSVKAHNHKTRDSAEGKANHKDADHPDHKRHAKGRDPYGIRNSPISRHHLNEISFEGIHSIEEWLKAEEAAALDARRRPRQEVGFSIVHSPCDDLQAPLNALLDTVPAAGEAVVERQDNRFKASVRERFQGARAVFGRHLDKIRIHSEAFLLKYDENGEKLKSCKAVGRDGPGVTALKSQAAVRGKEIKLGRSGKHWNSKKDVELSLALKRDIDLEIQKLGPAHRVKFQERLVFWKAELTNKVSRILTHKRMKKEELKEFEDALRKMSEEDGLGAALDELSGITTITPEPSYGISPTKQEKKPTKEEQETEKQPRRNPEVDRGPLPPRGRSKAERDRLEEERRKATARLLEATSKLKNRDDPKMGNL